MKQIGNYVVKALIAGAIVVVPIYLAILLLLKAAGIVADSCATDRGAASGVVSC